MRSIELFSGAGGLALGVARAGFHHQALVEWDRWATDTLQENKERGLPALCSAQVHRADVRQFDFGAYGSGIDLVAGGPPCQPFSLGGRHSGYDDKRDMFPAAARAVRLLKPRAFLFENVRGIARPKFAAYLEYIRLQLSLPCVLKGEQETWEDHRKRLLARLPNEPASDVSYQVSIHHANAADYGVPQRRDRVFIVGFRRDQSHIIESWRFPTPTHSEEALLWSKWVDGDYWERNRVPTREREKPSALVAKQVERLRTGSIPRTKAWATVREAISGLPEPVSNGEGCRFFNHKLQVGAKSYEGHTGSPLDEPAKALKAGVHGVPGGENMIRFHDGSVRYFTVRESARIQGFPDEFVFHGAWSEIMRQLGNAVPVSLASAVAASVFQALADGAMRACGRKAVRESADIACDS